MIGPGTVSDEVVLDLAARTTVVLLARRPLPGCDQIAVDNLVPTRELVRHLVRVHGLRRLRFVGELAGSRDVERRHEGYLQALAEAGLRDEHGPIEVELLESAAPPVVDHVLAHLGEIDALVCANDDLPLAISRGLALRGVRVPGDIAITGWDDIMPARYVLPGLTTVRQPMRELGVRLASHLHDRISGTAAQPEQRLRSQVVIRDTCGAPRPTEGARPHPLRRPGARRGRRGAAG